MPPGEGLGFDLDMAEVWTSHWTQVVNSSVWAGELIETFVVVN